MDINATTNLMNASDEEIARLNKILRKQLLTKTVFTVVGGVTVAVLGHVLKTALDSWTNEEETETPND